MSGCDRRGGGGGRVWVRALRVCVAAVVPALVLAVAGPAQARIDPGAVYSGGNNYFGQLGGGYAPDTSPILTSISQYLPDATAVAGGGVSGYALRADGTVWSFGRNDYGQLGDGTTTDREVPVQVSGLTEVKAIAGGGVSGYALKSDGSVWAWGRNDYGQLGDGTTTQRNVPVRVEGLDDVTAIAGGGWTGYALRADRTVWAWGHNAYGQVGDGTTTNALVPTPVVGLSYRPVVAIGAGRWAGYAVGADSTVWAWGANWHGQLGDASHVNRSTPGRVTVLSSAPLIGMVGVAGAGDSAYALGNDGTVQAWGRGDRGQLGDGTTYGRTVAAQVPGLDQVVQIAAGSDTGYALRADGTARAWGRGDHWQTGNADVNAPAYVPPRDWLEPVTIVGLRDVTAIAAGGYSGYAIVGYPPVLAPRVSARLGGQCGRSSHCNDVLVTNTGNAPLTIISIIATNNVGVAGSCGGTVLQPQETCVYQISHTPGALGPGTTTIIHDAPGGITTLVVHRN